MIEGTRPYRGKFHPEDKTPSEAPKENAPRDEAHDAQEPALEADAMNRRAWFSSLVPALGDGLVKILRVSNHLQDELKESSKPTR